MDIKNLRADEMEYPETGGTIARKGQLENESGITKFDEATISLKGIAFKGAEFFPNVTYEIKEESEGVGKIYTYHLPVDEMSNAEKLEAYQAWRDRDKFYFNRYQKWAEIKFNGTDSSGNGDPKVLYNTLMTWKRVKKGHR